MKCLGQLNWFRPFLKNLSSKLTPLTELLKTSTTFEWKQMHEEILSRIKNEIEMKPKLIFSNFNEAFQIECDASEVGIGGVVFQSTGIVGYYSRKLASSEKKYPVIENKALAIISTIYAFKNILWGSQLEIKIDHSNLSVLQNSKTQRIQRLGLVY